MLINGIVSLKTRNMNVPEWNFQWREYQKLLEWKTNEFDPMVEKAKLDK
jgi:hypothetical protein